MDSAPPALLVLAAPRTMVFGRATALRWSQCPGKSLEAKAAEWVGRLPRALMPVSVLDSYTGPAWQVIREAILPATAEGAKVLVASPGLGLVAITDAAANYAVSFHPEDPDSVGAEDSTCQRWWDALARAQEAAMASAPTSLAAWVRRYPGVPVLAAMGGHTLAALHADLWEAREAHADPERMTILTASARGSLGLGDAMVNIARGAEATPGTPHQWLEAQALGRLLAGHSITRIDNRTARLAMAREPRPRPGSRPPPRRVQRTTVSTNQIVRFLDEALARDPDASPGRLWRIFREAGWTCDRREFDQLHRSRSIPLFG